MRRQAANYLNIKSLLDLTCLTVANMIKGALLTRALPPAASIYKFFVLAAAFLLVRACRHKDHCLHSYSFFQLLTWLLPSLHGWGCRQNSRGDQGNVQHPGALPARSLG